jgi:hypothetical protein
MPLVSVVTDEQINLTDKTATSPKSKVVRRPPWVPDTLSTLLTAAGLRVQRYLLVPGKSALGNRQRESCIYHGGVIKYPFITRNPVDKVQYGVRLHISITRASLLLYHSLRMACMP